MADRKIWIAYEYHTDTCTPTTAAVQGCRWLSHQCAPGDQRLQQSSRHAPDSDLAAGPWHDRALSRPGYSATPAACAARPWLPFAVDQYPSSLRWTDDQPWHLR